MYSTCIYKIFVHLRGETFPYDTRLITRDDYFHNNTCTRIYWVGSQKYNSLIKMNLFDAKQIEWKDLMSI